MSLAVDARDLFHVYGGRGADAAALQGLTMQVGEGEVVAVLGPSGSGKSTLLRVLAALERPSAGTAVVLGRDVARLSSRRAAVFRARSLGLVDQHYDRALPPDLSCHEIVSLQLGLRGVEASTRRRRALELLERVGLADVAEARPGELSGGEQQRVAVVAALAHRPRLLLADEPSGELDTASAATVYALIGELARDTGATAVVVSHDPAAAVIADRSVRVRDGRLSGETPRAGEEAMVIGRTGWMHLPASVRRAGGLGSLVRAQPTPDGVLLTPADGASAPAPTAPRTEQSRDARAGGGVVAELRGVDKAFGQGRRRRRVFAGLDAGFQRGLLTVVTGRSGTGKSTLLHLLAGLEQPDAGEVTVLGEQLAGRDRGELAEFRRRNLALVGQQPGLVPFLSAEENVVLALTLRGVDEAEARARSGLWLSRLGLGHRLVHRVERLSAGERQRVAIARALAARPGVLLVDEPTSRLDRANAELTGRLLAEASSRHGETIVCATHDPLLVDRADRRLDLAG